MNICREPRKKCTAVQFSAGSREDTFHGFWPLRVVCPAVPKQAAAAGEVRGCPQQAPVANTHLTGCANQLPHASVSDYMYPPENEVKVVLVGSPTGAVNAIRP